MISIVPFRYEGELGFIYAKVNVDRLPRSQSLVKGDDDHFGTENYQARLCLSTL